MQPGCSVARLCGAISLGQGGGPVPSALSKGPPCRARTAACNDWDSALLRPTCQMTGFATGCGHTDPVSGTARAAMAFLWHQQWQWREGRGAGPGTGGTGRRPGGRRRRRRCPARRPGWRRRVPLSGRPTGPPPPPLPPPRRCCPPLLPRCTRRPPATHSQRRAAGLPAQTEQCAVGAKITACDGALPEAETAAAAATVAAGNR